MNALSQIKVKDETYEIKDEKSRSAIAKETQRAEKAEKDIAGNLYGLNLDVVGLQSDILNIRNKAARVDGNAFSATKNEVKLTTTGVDISSQFTVSLPSATTESAGVMSAEDKKKLDNLSEGGGSSGGGDVNVAWTSSSKMNNFVIAGIYNIKGERTMSPSFDNLPIYNSGGGHTISARLEVLDSSINDTTNSDDKCITQKLTLSNRVGGDGNVYIRTGRGRTLGSITWEPWATLQPNINVGEVRSLDNFVDNAIYSGVWTDDFSSFAETFVMITINDYAVAGDDKTVVQIKYAYDTFSGNGVPTFTTRSLFNGEWSDWTSIKGGGGSGGDYTLPIATADVLGGIKSATSRPIGSDVSDGRKCDVYVDGDNGLAHVVVAPASNSSYGVVKVDNSVDSESDNPVSGKAVADAIANAIINVLNTEV